MMTYELTSVWGWVRGKRSLRLGEMPMVLLFIGDDPVGKQVAVGEMCWPIIDALVAAGAKERGT